MAACDALRSHRVVIVGAGIGGLVAALLLAQRGLQVTVLERAAGPGGKMRTVSVGGAEIDSGPTVFTLRWIFDEILDAAGTSLQSELELAPLSILARHHWTSATGAHASLDLYPESERSAAAIASLAGAAEARRFLRFTAEAQRLYRTLEAPYICSARPSFWQMVGDLGPRGLTTLAALGPFTSLWRTLARHFTDVRLQQLFGRYATYCGASPWEAPATLLLLAEVERAGVWTVQGGMHAVARKLAQLAQARGARLRYRAQVGEIVVRAGRVAGVMLGEEVGGQEFLAADAVVFNGDAAALPLGLHGRAVRAAAPPMAQPQRSLSAVTWSLLARTSGLPLIPHNVFFQPDYAREFADIAAGCLPARPTVYVNAQDRDETGAARPALERLLCLVNAPALGDRADALDTREVDSCEQTMLRQLAHCGLQVKVQARQVTTPREFHRLFPATGGALYGRRFTDRSTGGWLTLFQRAAASTRVPGLYLAGGSVHPGPGVPMAAMSGRLAAATLLAHLDSTSRSRRVVISGGMSMPSATTAATRSPSSPSSAASSRPTTTGASAVARPTPTTTAP